MDHQQPKRAAAHDAAFAEKLSETRLVRSISRELRSYAFIAFCLIALTSSFSIVRFRSLRESMQVVPTSEIEASALISRQATLTTSVEASMRIAFGLMIASCGLAAYFGLRTKKKIELMLASSSQDLQPAADRSVELPTRANQRDSQRDSLPDVRFNTQPVRQPVRQLNVRSNSEGAMLNRTDCDVAKLLQNQIDLLNAAANKHNTRINSNVVAISNQSFKIDQTKFSQMLSNLIANAIKFSKGGEVDIRAFLTDDDTETVVMRIEVRDAGIGMTEPQLGDRTSDATSGTALDLASSQDIVKLMGGKMTATSLIGEGSVFTIHLPLKRALAPRTEVTPPVSQPVSPSAPPTIVRLLPEPSELLANVRVLVAEDNSTNQLVITSILRYLKIPFTIVTDGDAAVMAVQTGNYDLVLMDCYMPLTDGYEATRRIRALERQGPLAKRIPIIALTSSAQPDEREHCLRAGMDDFTTKPISSENLKKVLLSVIKKAA